MTAPRLDIQALRMGHHGRTFGTPLNLQLHGGEVLCLLGPNGCGKTTLFRTVLGLLRPLGGGVEVEGQEVGQASRAWLARRVAYVPQAHAAVFAHAVEDLVLMGRAPHLGAFATPSGRDRSIALAALQRLGVAHLRRRPCTELSGGERQLVLIARALAQQAAVIVMDEPTASLDFGHQHMVLREIAGLAGQGIAVLMSTHQPEHALRVADRVALMRHGSLLAAGPVGEVMTAAALAELYGLSADEVAHGIPGLAGRATASPPLQWSTT